MKKNVPLDWTAEQNIHLVRSDCLTDSALEPKHKSKKRAVAGNVPGLAFLSMETYYVHK